MLVFNKPFRLEIYTKRNLNDERKLVETETFETMEKAKVWAVYRMKCISIALMKEGKLPKDLEPWNAVVARILEEKAEGFIDAHGHDGWTEKR